MKKKIAISVDINLGDIIDYTLGNDHSDGSYPLSEGFRSLILKNLNAIKERKREELRKKLILNPETNRYDYDGDITTEFLKTLDLFKKDDFGNIIGFSINFGEVGGSFSCYNNQLTSLEGAPKEVGGDFDCYGNKYLRDVEFFKYLNSVGGIINTDFGSTEIR